jgi:hypothetical protein
MRPIVALCSREGIHASNLVRFPAVMAKVPQVLPSSRFKLAISELQRVLDAREELGFMLLDQNAIQHLVTAKPEHNQEQTEFIPPRIWRYQVSRLRECLEDYMQHQQQLEDCFNFCVDAYATNFGTLAKALGAKATSSTPFQNRVPPKNSGAQFHGHFLHTANRFGILELLERWVGELFLGHQRKGITLFSSFLSLVQQVGLAYILNFTLMRHWEGATLKADCLYIEEDDKLGKIYILCGETTKTDRDSDARWPTSPSVKIALDALISISRLRIRCAQELPQVALSAEDSKNPYLISRCYEPWAGTELKPYRVRPRPCSYSQVVSRFPKLFDAKMLEITEDDLRVARLVTPSVNQDKFQVGKQWPLAWHQLRRTGAVNMFSSGIVSDSTMQFQMKHLTRMMPLYYGRGHFNLRLSEAARTVLVNAHFEAVGREIAAVISDRFVSPYGDDHKKRMVAELAGFQGGVNVLREEDANRFEVAARRGDISFRRTVLGGCMSKEECNGDCIESIANCAGGNGDPPCKDSLFDRQRAAKNQVVLEGVRLQMASTTPDTPRYRALEQEKRGLENYFAYIK